MKDMSCRHVIILLRIVNSLQLCRRLVHRRSLPEMEHKGSDRHCVGQDDCGVWRLCSVIAVKRRAMVHVGFSDYRQLTRALMLQIDRPLLRFIKKEQRRTKSILLVFYLRLRRDYRVNLHGHDHSSLLKRQDSN